MSREFKFRIWNKATGEYEYTDKGLKLTFPGILANRNVIVDEWTGLKDKNGKEIYEGDIVEYDVCGGRSFEKGEIGIPKFKKGQYELGLLRFSQIENLKVIGNIHENADLLEVSE